MAAVRVNEVPGREALGLGDRPEQRFGIWIAERQQRDSAAAVESSDGTRREAAEASAAVVEQNGPIDVQGPIVATGPDPRLVRVSHLIEHHQSWALVLLFLLIGIESSGVPLPGANETEFSGEVFS